MKTIVAGTRNITEYNLLCEAMNRVDWEISEIVSGGSKGVDSLGEQWAKDNQISIKRFPADWDTYGRAAGPIRNAQMAKYADALIAVWDGKSPGTSNMINEAKELGLRVVVFMEQELRNKKASNPIKSNPIFGDEAEKRSQGEHSSISTRTIKFRGRILEVFEDPKKNTPLVNMVVALVEELNG